MISYPYQKKIAVEKIGDLEFTIECLRDLNETIDGLFEYLKASVSESEQERIFEDLCPYFGVVWPAARGLCEVLCERRAEFAGRRVFEVGCGLALPSLVASLLGASEVIASDVHVEVPRFLARNLELNPDARVAYRELDWSKGVQSEAEANVTCDWIVGSDILYERQHPEHVAKILTEWMRATGARALIADPGRPYLQSFVDEMKRLGFPAREASPEKRDVYVMEFARV